VTYLFRNLEFSQGWQHYAQMPPDYADQSANPYNGFSRSLAQGIPSPVQDGPCTAFGIGGTVVGDALFTLPIIGQVSSQDIPDTAKTLLPSIHSMEYTGNFFISSADMPHIGAVELDVGIYMGEISMTFGTQIRIANVTGNSGPNGWDVWDNANEKWVFTGIRTYPVADEWNSFRIVVSRDSSNSMIYESLGLNRLNAQVSELVSSAKNIAAQVGWWGLNINFQVDGTGMPVTVYARDLSLYIG
jgi:hypothetical protein